MIFVVIGIFIGVLLYVFRKSGVLAILKEMSALVSVALFLSVVLLWSEIIPYLWGN